MTELIIAMVLTILILIAVVLWQAILYRLRKTESEREADSYYCWKLSYNRKMQRLAEENEALEASVTALEAERDRYRNALEVSDGIRKNLYAEIIQLREEKS